MSVSFCLPHPVAVSAFMICRGLCACAEMLWMCVLYVSFGSKVRVGCVVWSHSSYVGIRLLNRQSVTGPLYSIFILHTQLGSEWVACPQR